MRAGRIKTDWASVSLAHDGHAIVCAKFNGASHCTWFESLEQLKQAIDSKKILVKKWAVAVPKSLCILKPIALPASDLAEAVQMTEFELPSLIPLPVDEVVCGCTLLSKQQNMLSVLACILKVKALNEYLKPYRAIGIEPYRIALNLLAIQNWFHSRNGGPSGPEISALVDRRHSAVLTGIDGNFQKAKEVALPSEDVTLSPREITEEVLRQRQELPDSLKGKAKISLAGVEEHVTKVKNLFGSMLSEPISRGNITVVPRPSVTRYAGDDESDHNADGLGYNAVIAAGLLDLAANSKFPYSNLLPQQNLKRLQQRTLLFSYLLTGLLCLLLTVLVWLCLAASNRRIERRSRIIQSHIAPIKQVAGGVDSKRQRVRAIEKQLSNRGQISQIFEDLYRYTPESISISELRFSYNHQDTSIELKGQADLLATAFEYTEAVREAALLQDIQVINAQQIPRPGGSVVEFKAYCSIPSE